MAIITAAGLTDLYNQRVFNKNGSTVTLKKISETDWILFGDLAEGDSEGFVGGGSGLDFGPIVEGIFVRTFSTGEFLPLQSVLVSNPNVSFTKGVDPETYTLVVQDGGEPGDEITHVGIVHGQFRFLGILAGESQNMATGTFSGFNTFTSREEFADNYSASRWFAYTIGGTRDFTGSTADHMTVRPPNSDLRLRRLSLSFQE